MPTYAPGQSNAGQTFNQTFTQQLQPFGTVRFMDWMNANTNKTTSWADRPQPQNMRYDLNGGVPIEQMVAMANQTNVDPWFTMPVMADANYVQQFATYVKQNLDPQHKVYVEYGNEVWGLTDPTLRSYIFDQPKLHGEPDYMWPKYWAQNAQADFRIWREVFAGQEDRVVRVAAGQTSNRWDSPRFYDALNGEFDVIAIAPYLNVNSGQYTSATTAQQIINDLRGNLNSLIDKTQRTDTANTSDPNRDGYLLGTDQAKGDWIYQKELADYFSAKLGRDIPLVAYEGGQSLAPGSGSSPWWNAYVEAERSPEMQQLYNDLLKDWFDTVGAELFMNYNYVGQITPSGAWGSLEYQGQDASFAPKYQALVDYAAQPVPEPTTAVGVAVLGGILLLLRRTWVR